MQKTYDYIVEFTETYKQHRESTTAAREVACLAVQFPFVFTPIKEGDLFAGRLLYPALGLAPEPLGGRGVCFNFGETQFQEIIDSLDSPQKETIQDIREFWRTENTRHKVRQAFPPKVAEHLPFDDVYYQESHVAFPLYRTVGIYIDYQKLLSLGIEGLEEQLLQRLALATKEKDTDGIVFLEAGVQALALFSEVCLRYAAEAATVAQNVAGNRKKEAALLHHTLTHISRKKPETFHQAMQLSFLYTLICGSLNYGRMDAYLGDFLARDIDTGKITEDTALAYTQSLWRLIAARETVFHGRVIIGGKGRPNEENADRFALLAIEASRTVEEIEPQLTLRLYEGANPLLMDRAYESIAQGRTYPMLYNDDVNVPAVASAFQLSLAEAQQYLPFGCGEYVIDHRSFGSPNGIINMLKLLEITMHGGYDPIGQTKMGLDTQPFETFETFDDFFAVYVEQMRHFIEILAIQQKIEYDVVAQEAPFLFMSLLYDDCIQRARPIFSGGIRYLGGTLETYGNVNTINSLFAIKDLVFDQKKITQKELMQALDANFEGYEEIQKMLYGANKYGNDLDDVDAMAVQLHETVCEITRQQKEAVGLHSYLVVIINNEANTLVGQFTAASADGRYSREFLANANNPTGGTDTEGLTAMLNSLVKLRPDIHAGAVQNIKFSKQTMENSPEKIKLLLNAYFAHGGTQAMITAVHRGELEAAMKSPEKYGHIMVRVGGFSARFVTLSRPVQREILSRTCY